MQNGRLHHVAMGSRENAGVPKVQNGRGYGMWPPHQGQHPDDLDPAALARRCQEETLKFQNGFAFDPSFCLELWRRSLHERSADAWGFLFETYEDRVRHWLRAHQYYLLAIRLESESYYVTDTFVRVWQDNNETPLELKSLPRILTYVKGALNLSILTCMRTRQRSKDVPIEAAKDRQSDTVEKIVIEREDAEQVWDCVRTKVQSEQELILLYLRWVCGWPPRQICEELPGTFSDVYRVSRQLEYIKDRLKRHCHGIVLNSFEPPST